MLSHATPRRLVAAIACLLTAGLTGGLLAGTAPAALANTPTPGLFGSADPTYDGVYRQSLAILGLTVADAPVPASAVAWLAGQQCPDGSFEAYRAVVARPCSAPAPAAFTGPDSNSTALAATALRASGRTPSANRAVAALVRTQNRDGGWGYTLGGASDVNSTGLALAAVRGASSTSATRSATARALRYLRSVQVPCGRTDGSRFGLPYQAGQAANALASVQALVGVAGTLPVADVARTRLGRVRCDDPFDERIAAYVSRQVLTNDGAIPSALGEGTDWNATAFAVLGLAAAGAAPARIDTAIKALRRGAGDFVGAGAAASPAAAGTVIQAAVAAGDNPRAFGPTRTNLVATLLATLQR